MSESLFSEFTGTFAPGDRYVTKQEAEGLLIRDHEARPVALLPTTPGGEVRSRDGRWLIAAERQGKEWLVVARDPTTDEPVACAYQRWWPNAFDLWVEPAEEYRLRQNPLTGTWTLRRLRDRIARITVGSPLTIELPETTLPAPQLTLLIVLAHETIRYDDTIRGVSTVGGGGG